MTTTIGRSALKKTPWQYLEDWERSERTKEQSTLEWINAEMRRRYPGDYRIVKRHSPKTFWEPHYHIQFDTPAVETYLRLKWC